jgi:hypothetical protein
MQKIPLIVALAFFSFSALKSHAGWRRFFVLRFNSSRPPATKVRPGFGNGLCYFEIGRIQDAVIVYKDEQFPLGLLNAAQTRRSKAKNFLPDITSAWMPFQAD